MNYLQENLNNHEFFSISLAANICYIPRQFYTQPKTTNHFFHSKLLFLISNILSQYGFGKISK